MKDGICFRNYENKYWISGKWALKQIVNKLPDATLPRPHVSDQTIGAVLGILFEIIKNSANYTRDFHELKGKGFSEFLQHCTFHQIPKEEDLHKTWK